MSDEDGRGGWEHLEVDDFRVAAAAWLADAAGSAPPDYGPIVPEVALAQGRAWQRRLADAGLVGLHWPVGWGGQGLTGAHTAVWLEECARAQVPPFLNMVGLVLAAEALLAHGTDAQRDAHLPGLRTGERLWCQLFSEPDAGSDLAHLRTRAHRTDTGWVIDGHKVWTSNGHVADWGICLARTDPDAPAHRGISFFLVDMRSPGVESRPLRQITGASDFDQVTLDDVEIPAEGLLGPEGSGWAVAMSTLTHERNHVGAMALRLRLRLDRMVADGEVQPVRRDRLTGLVARSRALVALGEQQDRLDPVASSLMKVEVAELSFAVDVLAAEAIGPAATLDGRAATDLVAIMGSGIAGGTTQVQKNIIAERALGLPREPRVP